MPDATSGCDSLLDIQLAAERVLPADVVELLDGGFNDDVTFNRTQRLLGALALRPRRFTDVSDVDCSTTVLGTKVAAPVMPSAAAPHTSCHPEGELAVTRAAGRFGTIQVVPHVGHFSYAECAAVRTGPIWAQCFLLKDRQAMADLVQGLEDSGFEAIVLTVDQPTFHGYREQGPHEGLVVDLLAAQDPIIQATDPSQSWKDIEWLREHTSLPIVLKGILRADMAEQAVLRGASGIVVSSHGARVFDGQVTSIEALPEIARQVAGRLDIFFDGGIRTGSDIFKVLALGAKAVLLGRPIFYGLGADGEAGVGRTLEVLRDELATAMRAVGRASVAEIRREDVALLS
jgi:4-hydroxymandelate oxidase